MTQRDLTFCQSRGGTHRLDWCVVHDSEWPIGAPFCAHFVSDDDDASGEAVIAANDPWVRAAIDALRERSVMDQATEAGKRIAANVVAAIDALRERSGE